MTLSKDNKNSHCLPSNQGKSIVYIWLMIAFFSIFALVCKAQYMAEYSEKRGLSVDESLYFMMSQQIVQNPSDYSPQKYYQKFKAIHPEHSLPSYFRAPLFKHPPLYTYLLSIPERFLGYGTVMNATNFSIFITLFLPIIAFLIGKELYDIRVGVLSFFLMFISPINLICSMRMWMECTLALFMSVTIYFFIKGWEKSSFYIISGIFFGLALLTKYPGFLVAPAIFIFGILCKPDIFKENNFYYGYVAAFLIFLPWMVWNENVYGTIFKGIFSLHGTAAADVMVLSEKVLSLFLKSYMIPVYIIIGSCVMKCYVKKTDFIYSNVILKKVSCALICLAAIIVIATLLLSSNVRGGIVDAFTLRAMPEVSLRYPNPFWGPWDFHFAQFLRMSPFYLLGYGSLLLVNTHSKSDKLLIIFVFIVMSFYLAYGANQTRYLMSVIPVFLILIARASIFLWDYISNLKIISAKKFLQIAFSTFFAYASLKTIIVNLTIAMPLKDVKAFVYF